MFLALDIKISLKKNLTSVLCLVINTVWSNDNLSISQFSWYYWILCLLKIFITFIGHFRLLYAHRFIDFADNLWSCFSKVGICMEYWSYIFHSTIFSISFRYEFYFLPQLFQLSSLLRIQNIQWKWKRSSQFTSRKQ